MFTISGGLFYPRGWVRSHTKAEKADCDDQIQGCYWWDVWWCRSYSIEASRGMSHVHPQRESLNKTVISYQLRSLFGLSSHDCRSHKLWKCVQANLYHLFQLIFSKDTYNRYQESLQGCQVASCALLTLILLGLGLFLHYICRGILSTVCKPNNNL